MATPLTERKFQIFSIEHFGHRGFGSPNGTLVEMIPLWEDAYAGKGYEFDSEYEANRFMEDGCDGKLNPRKDYIILPVYRLKR